MRRQPDRHIATRFGERWFAALAGHTINLMLEIIQARTEQEVEMADQLNREYLGWCVEQSLKRLGETLDFNELYRHSKIDQEHFLAATGRLLLAKEDGVIGGMACFKKIREDTCEIKRMYVQPAFRGRKIGEQLLSRLIEEARATGYSRILLDSDPYMSKAHEIYRSLGFVETEPYEEAEMDGDDYSRHMIYMELRLS